MGPALFVVPKILVNLQLLRCMGTPACFSAMWSKRSNFCYFLFASLYDEIFQEMNQLLKERICSYRSKFFPLRVEPYS